MGWVFDLKHANTVAYLTVPYQLRPPSLTVRQLEDFLGSLQEVHRENPRLISSQGQWIETVVSHACDASRWLYSQGLENNETVSTEVLNRALGGLRDLFKSYNLYGLAVGVDRDKERLLKFAHEAAYSSGDQGLFLIPDLPGDEDSLGIFNPSPVIKKITENPDRWPGILFWLPTGESSFAALDDAQELYNLLLQAIQLREGRCDFAAFILQRFNSLQDDSGVKRILHLSDLHFGNDKASCYQAYLACHLKSKRDEFDRVVITGDLYNNPRSKDAQTFHNFRHDLEAFTGKEAIVIPGNHDQKIYGNSILGVGRKHSQIIKLEWSNLVIDDDLKCVFFCFDTSRDAKNFAQGCITSDQMVEVATQFEKKCVSNPQLREYLSVALVHHHPYSFDTRTETLLQKCLRKIGLCDETFLRFHGAEDFLRWCAGRRVPLILHGHKHVPRHVMDRIKFTNGIRPETREVIAVGCGTSLGAEGMPLSYNILEWSPKSRRWSTAFYADEGFGAGFEPIYVTLHSNPR